MSKLGRTLEAVWYAAGPAQFLMYGIWVIVVSGMFSLQDGWQLLASSWKFMGFLVFVVTVWGTLKQKQFCILCCTITTMVVGAVYTSKAVHFQNLDLDTHRAATQSHYMVLAVLIAWGFYLANLCARQRMEFGRMGVSDE